MKDYLKILNLLDIPWYSGLSDYALSQCEVLEEYGHNVFWGISRESKIYNMLCVKRDKIIEISDRKKLLTPFEIYRLIKFIADKDIQIINTHTGRMQTLAYIISRFKKDIRIIRTKADAKEIKKSFTYSRVNFVICGSQYIKKMYDEKKINVKTIVIYKSIPHSTYRKIEKNLPFKIGILARLDPVKGHRWFIESAIEILKKGYKCKFLFAGIEANIKWKQLEAEIPMVYRNSFEYLGYVENKEEFIRKCHLGVIPSISSEAVSRVAVEWISNGRAVISTDVGSLPEFIEREFIVKPFDNLALCKKITEVLDFEKLEKIGNNNFNKFNKIFSYSKFKEQTLSLFKSIL